MAAASARAAWVDAGLGALTAAPVGRSPWGVAGFALDAARELRALGGPAVDGPALLAERARLSGWSAKPDGRTTVGGAARLLRAADGWCSLSLARPDDEALLPALFEDETVRGWDTVADAVAGRSSLDVVARAALLGMSAALVGEAAPRPPLLTCFDGAARARTAPLVVDLSALWAGPLAAHLLGLAGAEVVKVESRRRLDGARHGPAAFYDLLHGGHDSITFDPHAGPDGLEVLHRICREADVVITAARPRAIAGLGLDPSAVLATSPLTAWVSITGFGPGQPDRIGFGDDAAVAGGLVGQRVDGPCYAGDAIADPLTGLVAAVEVRRALADGRRTHVEVDLAGVAALAAAWSPGSPGPAGSSDAVDGRCTGRDRGGAAAAGRDDDRWRARLGLA